MNGKEKWTHPQERVDRMKVRLPDQPPKKGETVRSWKKRKDVKKKRVFKKRKKEARKRAGKELQAKLVMDLSKSKRLRDREIAILKAAIDQSKMSVVWLAKLRLTRIQILVICLMKHIHDIMPMRVALNAPFMTPKEVIQLLTEMGYIEKSKLGPKQSIMQCLKHLHAEGYLERVQMIGDFKAKPYRMITGGDLNKFFE